jgi:cell wall-associated NlpC family hydrolase
MLPVALLVSQLPVQPTAPQAAAPTSIAQGMTFSSLAPVDIGSPQQTRVELPQGIVGDPPIEGADIPMPLSGGSRSQLLAPMIMPATIAGDQVKVRNGPGLDYDEVSRMSGGTAVQVLGRFGDWLQVRTDATSAPQWVAGELVNLTDIDRSLLTEISKDVIPAPPPPKVGMVRETGLNLRDGPGTNYVGMTKLNAGDQLTLVQQFENWLFVEREGGVGWVRSDFLDIAPGVLTRVPVAETIPDANPALVGTIADNLVNLRGGPGTAYGRVTTANAGAEVSLLARHKDWYQIQLGNGTKAWIFSDLINVSGMVQRRVPVTNNIPALPARTRTAAAASRPASSANAAAIPVSGDVASYAMQFVGYPYVFGGTTPAGFDCSGFTQYVYRQFGVSIPRTAAAQFNPSLGAVIGDMGSLQPGDLVFFVRTTSGPGITHVALYVGNGVIVHAMTPALGVGTSSLYTAYWQNRFYAGIRVNR